MKKLFFGLFLLILTCFMPLIYAVLSMLNNPIFNYDLGGGSTSGQVFTILASILLCASGITLVLSYLAVFLDSFYD